MASRFQPFEKCSGFVHVAQAHQCSKREASIANPGVPIVPVAYATNSLREPKGWCRNYRAELLGSKQLEGQRRTIDGLAPSALVFGPIHPTSPEVHRRFKRVLNVSRARRRRTFA